MCCFFWEPFLQWYNGSSGTHTRILFLLSPVFTAAFSLGEHSSVSKSRERNKKFSQWCLEMNCICLSGRQVLKGCCLDERKGSLAIVLSPNTPPHTHLSTQRFLMTDMKEFSTQGPLYCPFVVLDQTLLFSSWVSQFFWQATSLPWIPMLRVLGWHWHSRPGLYLDMRSEVVSKGIWDSKEFWSWECFHHTNALRPWSWGLPGI